MPLRAFATFPNASTSSKNCKYYAQIVNVAGKFFSVRVTFVVDAGLITFSFMLSWHLILCRDHIPNAFKTL